jgi:predicted enzyme related to lactoylglutathione lyase
MLDPESVAVGRPNGRRPPLASASDANFAEFETGTVTLGVVDPVKMGIGELRPNANHVALRVEDVEAARSTLEQRGVTFHGDTFDSGVCHMAFFKDPDGNGLMLHHRYAAFEDGSLP